MRVVCVLRSGGEFRPEHVALLAQGIQLHNDLPIICLSDVQFDVPGVEVRPLQHTWPKWWPKIELFREFFSNQQTLYLDLDTVVVGRLPASAARFAMLADVYKPGDFGSGVMSWRGDFSYLYRQFAKQPLFYMSRYKTRRNWGDQGYIRDHLGFTPQTFGEEYRSFKAHCANGIPEQTKVVYFHGKPRPWEIPIGGATCR